MKLSFKFILPLLMAIITIVPSTAQSKKEQLRMSRAQLIEVQAKEIAKELSLDEATSKRFIEVFTQCQNEIWNARPSHQHMKRAKSKDLTEEEAEKILKDRFACHQKITDIKEKYYTEYSKFLSQRQIIVVYRMEHRMMDKMFHEHMKNRKHRHTKRRKATSDLPTSVNCRPFQCANSII